MNPQIVVLFKSRGRSGKGILMEIVSAILSSMMTTENPSLLHVRFQNWAFFQRRLIYLDEHNARDANFDRWKEISGSSPRVNFETKGVQTMIQADVQCAIIAVTNSPPSYEKGSAWEERLKMLDFPNSYVENPRPDNEYEKKVDYGLKDKLMTELPGILNKFLVYARYSLDNPDEMFMEDIPYSEIERALDRATDSLETFINDFCELAPVKQDHNGIMRTHYDGYSTTDITFMKKYEEYCDDPIVNVKALSKSEVKKKLKKDYRVIVERHNLNGIKVNYPIPT
jgi:phage/plasmid-associated DNA primase